jgi:hypothetical protein
MPAEQGIAEVMVDLYPFSRSVSGEMLFGWHRMVTSSRRDLTGIGKYRTNPGTDARSSDRDTTFLL